MKFSLMLLLLAAALFAQPPAAPGPDTVVLTVAGQKVTVADLQKLMETFPPAFSQEMQKDPTAAVRDAFIIRHLAAEGDKLKLGEQSPLKEQIEVQREHMIFQAMLTHERNFFQVTPEAVDDFYKANQARYQQTEIKVIKVAFKPGAASAKTVEQFAQQAVEAAHAGTTRTEADAQKLAGEIVAKLRNGGDFVHLVAQYSDDAESKAAGGDFGTVKPTSAYTDEFKKAVFALKQGQFSEPIRSGPALYIVRAEKISVQPLSAVREQIMDEIKNAHLGEFIKELDKQFTPVIDRPDLLVRLNAAGAQRPPAK